MPPARRFTLVPPLLGCWLVGLQVLADSTIVFNEVMYHPPGNAPELEWVELHNQMAVDMDISGWSLADGVFFLFPEGTVVPGGGFVIVAASPAALQALGFAGALGPFAGRLDDSGERLVLADTNGRLMDRLRYNDERDWPVEADGSGASLAKVDPDSASAPAASWASSLRVGGTPGEHNFPGAAGTRDLPAGLVSWWSFDEPSGKALDSADSNHGTLGAGARRVAGAVGGAVTFDNTAEAYVSVGTGTGNNFSTTTGITVEAVIKPLWGAAPGDHDEIFRKEDGANRVLLSFQNDGNQNGFSQPPVGAGPVLSFGLNAGGAYKELDMPLDGAAGRPTLAGLEDGRFHHVAATYDSATGLKAIYVDGVLAYSFGLAPGGTIASGGGSTAYIGNMNGRGEPFTGAIDEVAFWREALGADEIAEHHARSRAGQGYFSPPGEIAGGARVAFNEIFAVAGSQAWLALSNHGQDAVDLEGFALVRAGPGGGEHVFGSSPLAAGGYLVLGESQLGFGILPGDKLFLYAPGREAALAGARVEAGHRARHPEATGPWLVPDRPTPGAANSFALRDEVVINEILYHHRAVPESPPVFEETTLLALDASWRFNASGVDPGPSWREPAYDDGAWPSGPALLYNETADLPGPKSTALPLGPITFYFRARFSWDGDPAGARLAVRHVTDDGAVFYLNGAEVYRFNMPPGAVGPSTLASPGVGDAALVGPVSLAAGSLVSGSNVLSVEVHQGSTSSSDIVFGASVVALRTVREGTAFGESPEAWIELYNRSARAVDLGGWSLAGGIEHRFEDGTAIAPGGYLVVATDEAYLEALHPGLDVAGELLGRLSHKDDRIVLRDEVGNPADEVHYFDGGRWPGYADGGGSSLELRDPRADNSKPEAWAASDEGSKSRWRTYSFREAASAGVGPTLWNELVLGLLDAGEVLLDDLSVVESPDSAPVQLLESSTFDDGTSGWRLLGNHGRSRVVDDPEEPGNPVLHLIASGPTEHMHNHAETTFAGGRSVTNGRLYEVSFRALWLAGSSQLHTRLYFNRAPQTTHLDVPAANGTPGERNSTHEENIGPTFDDLRHAPVAPSAAEKVEVSVAAEDPDGVASSTLWWSVNGGAWSSAPMTAGPGGLYRREIPAQAAGSTVQLYVEAVDRLGARSTFPDGGRDSRALYKVDDGQAVLARLHNFRIVMTAADTSFLHLETNVMSNERLGATVVYDERLAFYDAGVRLKGSERGRPEANRVGFNVQFHPDRLFRGVHEKIHIDRSGGWSLGGSPGQDEILIKHMVNVAGGIPGMYDDIVRVIAPRSAQTGSALLLMARFDDVYLDSQYVDGSRETMHKLELIYYPTTTTDGTPQGLKRPQPDQVTGTDLRDLGDDKEAYRWTFLLENNRERDDYGGLIALCKAFGLPAADLEAGARQVMDTSEWMRTFAMYSLTGVNDTYTQGNNHNNIYYRRPGDGKMLVFPWDMDFSFNRPTNAPLWGDQNLSRIISLAPNRRLFLGHLRDLIERSFNPTYMAAWTAHYGSLAGQNYGPLLSYIGARRSYVLAQLPARVPFRITTNGGLDFTTSQSQVTLEGDAWIDVAAIVLDGRRGLVTLEPAWTTPTHWQAPVDLASGENPLTLLGFDFDGDLIASTGITVTSSAAPQFIRGDANLDGSVDLSDAVRVLFHLFRGLEVPCEDSADADDDEALSLTDALHVLGHLFKDGPPPAAPYPARGPDPGGAGPLGCGAGI
ncbi:MAG: lamin tail domain-containing protein [Planctomycetes bacterium]|nr:lamin tail domain-containing protein [Planctomycetota bacterium]